MHLGCGFFVFIVSIYGFVLLQGRLGLPPDIKIQRLLQKGAEIQLDEFKIKQEKDVEFILSQRRMEGRMTVLFTRDMEEEREIKLVRFYSQAPFPLMYLIIGLFCLAIGFLVFILRSEERKAHIFYWASLALSSAVIINGGYYCLSAQGLSYVPGVLFYFAYPLAPVFLLHFSLTFFSEIKRKNLILIYIPALVFAIVLETTFLISSLTSSIEAHRFYHSIFYVFRLYIVIFVLSSIVSLIISFRRASLEVPRAQLKWILYGLFVGLGPFIILYQLPQVFRANPLIHENIASVFFIFIPIAIAFAIIKFKLMNIELLINRSVVYGTLTIFTVSLYLFAVYVFQHLLRKFFYGQELAVSALAALAAAAAFHPARKRIQNFVDKTFYRLSYDYRKTILSFNEKAQRMISQDHLINFFLNKVQNALLLEHLGIYLCAEAPGIEPLFIKRGKERELADIVPGCLKSRQILARKGALHVEENIDFTQDNLLKEKRLHLILPLSFRHGVLSGFLTLGSKLSGEGFSRDDLGLLQTMAGELVLNLERIRLQEEVICERAEKEKLDELSRLKTEFISTVSHELRTPMSSIQGLTEVLQEGRIKDEARKGELIKLVASESSRLSRLLHNILDFGKIEHQAKSYDFQRAEIRELIQEVIKLFQYSLEKDGFILRTFFPKDPLYLIVDQDAVKEALTNLIDNAMKYSLDKREIDIEVIPMENYIEIQVRDKGIGVPLEDQEKIFDKFYRHPEAIRRRPKGVGLGLKIVRHIMQAHRGEIRVASQSMRGSTFSLIFPKP